MSLKELFLKKISAKNAEALGNEIESADYTEAYNRRVKKLTPHLDFSNPENFAKFGSAEEYYNQSIKRIYNTYPYDGSLYEKVEWHNSSSYLDNYLFDERYPRRNGYAMLCPQGWGSVDATSCGYGSGSQEYILLKGGPHVDNVVDVVNNRESNLKIGGPAGNTVEFWMRKKAFDAAKTEKEVIFDLFRSGSLHATGSSYGRLTIELTSSAIEPDRTSPFLITYMSGGADGTDIPAGFGSSSIGTGITNSTIADDTWHHYAFVFYNSGSNCKADLYIDGKHNHSIVSGSAINYVSGNMHAAIGALITNPSGNTVATKGWGKLSASLDEFRFWKSKRTPEDVGRYWFTQVGGGTNTDVANTDLGVYYKFNEGITGTSSVDAAVLDYSGRVSNGEWIGYASGGRSTGSAMIEGTASLEEFKDPIVYSFHPKVKDLKAELINQGRRYDYSNNAALYNSFPEWIIEEDQQNDENNLLQLSQIMGSYFDELYFQIKFLPRLKDIAYTSSSFKPLPFARHLMESQGLITPDLFLDATVLETFLSRNETEKFQEKIYDVKNLIYQNIYNNLAYIYKSKGTEKSLRNLIRCFGIDDELARINMYAHNATYEFKDSYRYSLSKKKYADFSRKENFTATVYQQTSSVVANSAGNIAHEQKLKQGHAATVEAEIMFPKKPPMYAFEKSADNKTIFPDITSSLFGVYHTASQLPGRIISHGSAGQPLFNVFAIKQAKDGQDTLTKKSKDVYFMLSGSTELNIWDHPLPLLTSSVFRNVYDNEKWNFAVRIKPQKHPLGDTIEGTSGSATIPGTSTKSTIISGSFEGGGVPAPSPYVVEFYGVSTYETKIARDFLITGTISQTSGALLMESAKSLYVGAHRQSLTGTVLQKSDVKVSGVRYWLDYLTNDEIKAHAFYPHNFGREHPYRNAYLFQGPLVSGNMSSSNSPDWMSAHKYIPQIDTLILHWDFASVTGSDKDGNFLVYDISSGSTLSNDNLRNKYGWFGPIAKKYHTGWGQFFATSSVKVVDFEYANSIKQQLPETINSTDMVNVLANEEIDIFTRTSRPVRHFFAVEKSMYQTISEEILNFFSTVKDFNNLVGEPVNRYRQEYKHLAKLRQLFFDRIGNEPDLEQYVEYYKWIDGALMTLLQQLVPAAAPFSDSLWTSVESHVLERSKYWTKLPTLEHKALGTPPVTEANNNPTPRFETSPVVQNPKPKKQTSRNLEGAPARGSTERDYEWKRGHAPLPESAPQEAKNSLWWAKRAERWSTTGSLGGVLSSRDATIDRNRQTLFAIVQQRDTMCRISIDQMGRRNEGDARPLPSRNREGKRQQRAEGEFKKRSFIKGATEFGANTYLIIRSTDVEIKEDSNDITTPNEKIKLSFGLEDKG